MSSVPYSFSTVISKSIVWQRALRLLEAIESYGGEAYIVGGALRDALWGKIGGDIDIATSFRPQEILRLFPKSYPTGAAFGTVTVIYEGTPFEVTTFRKEVYPAHDRHPQVEFADALTTDLARRDFTINALAWRRDGMLIDPFSGLKDLRRRRLKTVGRAKERFQEDPLRLLRALRFAWTYNLSLDRETHEALFTCRASLRDVSPERIVMELEKMFAHIPPLRMARGLDRYALLMQMEKMEPFVALSPEDGPLFWWAALALGGKAAVPFTVELKRVDQPWSWAMLPLPRKTRRLIQSAETLSRAPSNLGRKRLSLEALLQRGSMVTQINRSQRTIDTKLYALSHMPVNRTQERDLDVAMYLWLWTTEGAKCVYQTLRIEHLDQGYPRIFTLHTFSTLARHYSTLHAPKLQDLALSMERLVREWRRPAGRWVGELQKKLWEAVNFSGLPNEESTLLEAASMMMRDL